MTNQLTTAFNRLEADLEHKHTTPASQFLEGILTAYGEGLLDIENVTLALENWRNSQECLEYHVRTAARSNPEMLCRALEEVEVA
ncbi:MAG: hypothetical protein FJW36_23060 [Acidobacteria bacterium]|nr:hypothetical protein [Acidobacteriota bacterium]